MVRTRRRAPGWQRLLPITLDNFLRQSCVRTSNALSRVPFSIAKDVVADLAHAVILLQARCILHRDIKPGNVCVKSAGQPLATAPYSLAARPTAILCDFGLARDIAPTQSLLPDSTTNIHGLLHKGEPLTEKVCTLWYRAPEIIQRTGYGLPSDLWSLGLVFVRIAVGRHVFQGTSAADQLQLYCKKCTPIYQIPPQFGFWPGFKFLVSGLLTLKPEHRIPAAELERRACL